MKVLKIKMILKLRTSLLNKVTDVIMVHEEAAKTNEIQQDFQKSPPVLVSQEGKLTTQSPHIN